MGSPILAGEGDPLDGMLRISSADWFGTYVLPPVLARFSLSHSKVVVELVSGARLFAAWAASVESGRGGYAW
ncbi:LysR substrate binding domain-containing protein [Azotobacter beijerinckii]|uniref:LysR substrate binding domain-containing protein n=1 Tax=Azotobacter beijerinckii TaxID=170623 RepID=A0A1H9FFF6_9GAMM|nr:hypothetical protein [Azotobacter beijerinckii]SEI54132.1 LysR substrate binding domain-containing protein [Azotobacter beijerinckii]SEQ36647.1 LysR substrate binding domain-containing protein [Azotobacter beijerinckii]